MTEQTNEEIVKHLCRIFDIQVFSGSERAYDVQKFNQLTDELFVGIKQALDRKDSIIKELKKEIERLNDSDALLKQLNHKSQQFIEAMQTIAELQSALRSMNCVLKKIWHEGVCAGKLKDEVSEALTNPIIKRVMEEK